MKTVKKLILFDIDGTLIDFDLLAKKRRANMLRSIQKGTLLHEISTFLYFWLTPYELLDYHKLVGTLYDPALIRASVYSDVKNTLASLSRTHTLGIWSQANTKQQLHKLKSIELLDLFHKDFILISKNKKSALAKLQKQHLNMSIIVVDNQIDMVEDIQGKNVHAFLIQRNKNSTHNYMHIINSLTQLMYSTKSAVRA